MELFGIFRKKQTTQVTKSEPVSAEVEASMEDDLLSSIKQFREQQSSVRDKFLKENDEKLAPAQEKIERAEKFMIDTGMDESIPKIVKHIWHWASWSQDDSIKQYTAFDVSDISGEKNGLKEWNLSFEYNECRYQFIFREQESYCDDGSQYSDMSLIFNDVKVLEIDCSSNLDRRYDEWSYLSVKFLVIGDWVHSVVEMDELIELYDLKSLRDFGESMIVEQAENLPD